MITVNLQRNGPPSVFNYIYDYYNFKIVLRKKIKRCLRHIKRELLSWCSILKRVVRWVLWGFGFNSHYDQVRITSEVLIYFSIYSKDYALIYSTYRFKWNLSINRILCASNNVTSVSGNTYDFIRVLPIQPILRSLKYFQNNLLIQSAVLSCKIRSGLLYSSSGNKFKDTILLIRIYKWNCTISSWEHNILYCGSRLYWSVQLLLMTCDIFEWKSSHEVARSVLMRLLLYNILYITN